jgi:L-ribulokinase
LVTCTIVLSNSGAGDALGVVLTDALPAEVTFGGWVQQNGAIHESGVITWTGAVAGGAHPDFHAAVAAMTRLQPEAFEPDAGRAAVYERLFALYRRLHDAFGLPDGGGALHGVMKELLDIRDRVRAGQRM